MDRIERHNQEKDPGPRLRLVPGVNQYLLKEAFHSTMHSRTPTRNRLAKVLTEEWRKHLLENGVPKRKYTAICRATLTDGRVIDELIIEEGWIVALSRAHIAGIFEQRIDFDPRTITDLQIVQVA